MPSLFWKSIIKPEASANVLPKPLLALVSAFDYTPVTSDVPLIVAEYPVLNAANITIGLPLERKLSKMVRFLVAIRFVNEDGDVVRYCLHRPNNTIRFFFPDYESQTIGADAILEIWSIPGEGNATTDGVNLTFVVNDMEFYTGNDTRFLPSVTDITTTLVKTTFVATPSGPSNPFIDNAELTSQ